jgi:hypothetical protein
MMHVQENVQHRQRLRVRVPVYDYVKVCRSGIVMLIAFSTRTWADPRVEGQLLENDGSSRGLDFCSLLDRRLGAVHICVRLQKDSLEDSDIREEIAERLHDEPSISLEVALERFDLTDAGKVFLAYHIIRAAWEHYDSAWMRSRWTTDTIQFIPQHLVSETISVGYHPLHPYMIMNFGDVGSLEKNISQEKAVDGVVHKALRFFALGVVLMKIFSKKSRLMSFHVGETVQEALNNELSCYLSLLESDQWLDMESESALLRQDIKTAVHACFDPATFQNNVQDAKLRRNILYTRVLRPLERLVQDSGLAKAHASWRARELDPVDAEPRMTPIFRDR